MTPVIARQPLRCLLGDRSYLVLGWQMWKIRLKYWKSEGFSLFLRLIL